MESFLYILYSEGDKGYYIGSTRNLKDRIERHIQGRSLATKNRLPVKLVYQEKYASYDEAVIRELFLKKQKSKRFIEQLLIKNNLELPNLIQ